MKKVPLGQRARNLKRLLIGFSIEIKKSVIC